jgi:ABC-2 type transport system ATP-binding protein
VRQAPLAELSGGPVVLARTPGPAGLERALREAGLAPAPAGDGALRVPDASPAQVGGIAHRAGVELHELRAEESDLERTFFELTRAAEAEPPPGGPPPAGRPADAAVPVTARDEPGTLS